MRKRECANWQPTAQMADAQSRTPTPQLGTTAAAPAQQNAPRTSTSNALHSQVREVKLQEDCFHHRTTAEDVTPK